VILVGLFRFVGGNFGSVSSAYILTYLRKPT